MKNFYLRGLLRALVVAAITLSTVVSGYAQSCNCTDYVYLNDEVAGITHKFTIGTNSLTEVDGDPNTGGTQPWLDFMNIGFATTESPHGLAVDINGFIYIGNNFQGNSAEDGIYRFDCEANATPVSQSTAGGGGPTPYIQNDQGNAFLGQNGNATGTNFVSYGNYIIHNLRAEGVVVISAFCDGNSNPDFAVGQIEVPNNDVFEQWGLADGADGRLYATVSTNNGEILIYSLDPNTLNFEGTNAFPAGTDVTNLIIAAFDTPANNPPNNPNAGTNPGNFDITIQGIDADAAGNVYVMVNSDFGGSTTESGVFKLDPTLTTVLASDVFRNDISNRPGIGRGLVYDEPNNRIYVSGGV